MIESILYVSLFIATYFIIFIIVVLIIFEFTSTDDKEDSIVNSKDLNESRDNKLDGWLETFNNFTEKAYEEAKDIECDNYVEAIYYIIDKILEIYGEE